MKTIKGSSNSVAKRVARLLKSAFFMNVVFVNGKVYEVGRNKYEIKLRNGEAWVLVVDSLLHLEKEGGREVYVIEKSVNVDTVNHQLIFYDAGTTQKFNGFEDGGGGKAIAYNDDEEEEVINWAS